jgi:regulator of PEP synthase PpsR (kinase-PPPase family)
MGSTPPPIYIVSGALGASGEQLVNTVLAQFPDIEVPVIKVSNVRRMEQIEETVAEAEKSGGTIVHTLVDADLRQAMIELGEKRHVVTIDLMGSLFSRLTDVLGQSPVGQPGLYRRLHQAYFDRVAAIEFTRTHDDGQNPQDLAKAEIVLVGVSRSGKTPLATYLSVLGWKVANVPLIKGFDPPEELFQIDHRRVIGLNIEPDQLLIYRKERQRRMGQRGPDEYTNLASIYEEVEAARRVFRKHRFSVIQVTNRPIEANAAQVMEFITK